MLRKLSRTVRGILVGLLVLAVFVSGVAVAKASPLASHQFTDVPTSASYHNAVEWLVNREITFGCTVTQFCPNNTVTRAQMALFMQRLGAAFTPVIVYGTDGYTALDIDLSPVVCDTGGYTTGDYPQQATLDAYVGITGSAALGYSIVPMFSTNGGATWNFAGDFSGNFHRASIGASGEWANASMGDNMLLATNTTYNFGIRVGRVSGTADPTDYRCDLMVTIENENGVASPFRGTPGDSTDRNP